MPNHYEGLYRPRVLRYRSSQLYQLAPGSNWTPEVIVGNGIRALRVGDYHRIDDLLDQARAQLLDALEGRM